MRLGSSMCQRIKLWKISFHNLARVFSQPLIAFVKCQHFKRKIHGIKFEPTTRDKVLYCHEALLKENDYLKRDRDGYCPIHVLAWGYPGGPVIVPFSSSRKVGTKELKLPKGRKNHISQEAMEDGSIKLVDGTPHSTWRRSPLSKYNTRIQVVMGICGLQRIELVVYPFEAMKDTRVIFLPRSI